MALTQISTQGIKDGTITGSDLATNVDLVDDQKIRFGTGNDLKIYHGGTNSIIQNSTGDLYFKNTNNLFIQVNDTEAAIYARPNGAVELYHDNSKKFETDSNGVTVTGQLRFTDDNSIIVRPTSSSLAFNTGGSERLRINSSGHVKLPDTKQLQFGGALNSGDGDLQIYHDGTNSYVANNTGGGHLIIQGNGDTDKVVAINPKFGENGLVAKADGAVELYHDNSKKFETASHGLFYDGTGGDTYWYDGSGSNPLKWLYTDNVKNCFGTGSDLQIYHDGTNSVINNTTNDLRIESDRIELNNQASNEFYLTCTANGAVDLYYDNSRKLRTNSTGVQVGTTSAPLLLDNLTSGDGGQDIGRVGLNRDNNSTSDRQIWNQYTVAPTVARFNIFARTANDTGTAGNYLEVDTVNNNFDLPRDNLKLRIGASADLQLFHDGTENFLDANSNVIIKTQDGENMAKFIKNGTVELYHNNVKRFETDSNGVRVVAPEGEQAILRLLGDEADDADDSFRLNAGGGTLRIQDASNQSSWEDNIVINAAGSVELYHDNSKKLETTSVGVTMNDTVITNGEIRPASDNDHSIGRSNRRYVTYFGVNGSINTSDKNEKNTITDSDLGLDFINKLKPISYKWNKDDGKTHYGLIAQDLEETLTSLGKTIADFGGIYKEDDSPMGLGYSELIAPLIKAVQELSTEVAALKAS